MQYYLIFGLNSDTSRASVAVVLLKKRSQGKNKYFAQAATAFFLSETS